MIVRLDPRSREPIYAQIADQIKYLVAAGRLKPGDQLPTVRQLAGELGLNPNTVARAYTLLAGEGVLSTQQGRGTYVLDRSPRDWAKLRREKLIGLVSAFLRDMVRLGYTPAEVEKIWTSQFAVWRRKQ